jgi:hypothetical protein
MSQNGKGDTPRKKGVSERVWSNNWEKIFGKNRPQKKRSRQPYIKP